MSTATDLAALGAFDGMSADDAKDGVPAGLGEKRPPSQATLLIQYLEDERVEFFRNAAGLCFGSVIESGHLETWLIESRAFADWCSRLFYRRMGRAIGGNARRDALANARANALFDGTILPVALRAAQHEDAIYVDLVSADWQVARITAKGWSIVDATQCPVRFWRTPNMLALPHPERGGSLDDDLRPFVRNVDDQSFELLKAFTVAALRANVPMPVLELAGPQGSGKSTVGRRVRSIIDPNLSPLRSEPRELRDMGAAARNNYVVAFDNLSSIPTWMSDALCRLATGGGIAGRELYTDAEEHVIDALRPTIITAIENIVVRGDLADRILLVPLAAIGEEERRTDAELDAAFDAARPRLFGAVLTAMSVGLRRLPEIKASANRLARLADFDLWSRAALGLDFEQTYRSARRKASLTVLEASPLTDPLRMLAEGDDGWFGSFSDLFKIIVPSDDRERRDGRYPKTQRALSSALVKLIPDLATIGVNVTIADPDRNNRRMVTIVKGSGNTSATSATSAKPYVAGVCAADVGADVCGATSAATSAPPATSTPYADVADVTPPRNAALADRNSSHLADVVDGAMPADAGFVDGKRDGADVADVVPPKNADQCDRNRDPADVSADVAPHTSAPTSAAQTPATYSFADVADVADVFPLPAASREHPRALDHPFEALDSLSPEAAGRAVCIECGRPLSLHGDPPCSEWRLIPSASFAPANADVSDDTSEHSATTEAAE